jgi:hypothetical protein
MRIYEWVSEREKSVSEWRSEKLSWEKERTREKERRRRRENSAYSLDQVIKAEWIKRQIKRTEKYERARKRGEEREKKKNFIWNKKK